MAQSLEVLRGVADQYFVGLYEPIKQNPVLDRRPEAVRMAARIGLLYAGEQAILIANRGYEFADPMAEEPDIMTLENFPGRRDIETMNEENHLALEVARTNFSPYGDSVAVSSGTSTLAIAVPGFGVVHKALKVVEQVGLEGYCLVSELSDSKKINNGEHKFGSLGDIYRAIKIATLYNEMISRREA